MAFADRDQIVRTNGHDSSAPTRELMAGILLVTLIVTLGIRQLVPAEAMVPAIVTLLFAGSAVTAGLALACRRGRLRTMWFDLAGGLTFVGIVVSVLIEPDQLVRLFSASDRPE
jgi:hypothetical protein